jgi:hypothetical protein
MGKDLEGSEAIVPVSLAAVFAGIETQTSPVYRFEFAFLVTRPDRTLLDMRKSIEVPLPQTTLELSEPTRRLVLATSPTLRFTGSAELGSLVFVGGQQVSLSSEGRFEAQLELAAREAELTLPEGADAAAAQAVVDRALQTQGVEVEVSADAPGKVAQSVYVNVLRVSPATGQRFGALGF